MGQLYQNASKFPSKSYTQWGQQNNEIFGVPQDFAQQVLLKIERGEFQDAELWKSDFFFYPGSLRKDKDNRFPCFQTFPQHVKSTDAATENLLESYRKEDLQSRKRANFFFKNLADLHVSIFKILRIVFIIKINFLFFFLVRPA